MWPRFILLFSIVLLAACNKEPQTGPIDVHFDRDICDHCRMVLSDPRFIAEIRYFPPGKRSKVAKFDDVGCAVIWLQKQPFADDPKVEIWVADHRNKKWIDARTATYVPMKSTPMEYGLGAQADPAANGVDFAQAKLKIDEVEKRFNVHGLQLQDRLREQARQREINKQGEVTQ
jgi:nitrous oxide reductase accessory protein NosL